ncbi:hypothetical protein [Myceligenerans indicum]|uniref:Uncharacterized protein n=1 Tax=Myceligenerans indicum TaxID=2593663 RepID=A0ABS1LFE0_9MICO|nr:hypothetical protein [Myceligenerans indicum]MBL0884784.1 hypothetical protein [Myceligenerans indicum]
MSLWGSAIDAEVLYRQELLRQAWGSRTKKERPSRRGRRGVRAAAGARATQIRRGLEGMRPEPARDGRLA